MVTPDSDLTGKIRLRGLPADQHLCYRVRFADLDDRGLAGEPETGSFRAAPARHRDLRSTWSGDLAGQGWGINPDFGGFRIFDAMLTRRPDRSIEPDIADGDHIVPIRKAAELVARFDRADVETRHRMITARPPATGDARWNALIAGLAEWLAVRGGLPPRHGSATTTGTCVVAGGSPRWSRCTPGSTPEVRCRSSVAGCICTATPHECLGVERRRVDA